MSVLWVSILSFMILLCVEGEKRKEKNLLKSTVLTKTYMRTIWGTSVAVVHLWWCPESGRSTACLLCKVLSLPPVISLCFPETTEVSSYWIGFFSLDFFQSICHITSWILLVELNSAVFKVRKYFGEKKKKRY